MMRCKRKEFFFLWFVVHFRFFIFLFLVDFGIVEIEVVSGGKDITLNVKIFPFIFMPSVIFQLISCFFFYLVKINNLDSSKLCCCLVMVFSLD